MVITLALIQPKEITKSALLRFLVAVNTKPGSDKDSFEVEREGISAMS